MVTLRARGLLALLSVALLIASAPGPAAGAAVDEPALIVAALKEKIGSRFKIGTAGPRTFDCSGLVWYVYNSTGLAERIGGKRLRAREFQRWFRERGLLSAKDPQIGDVVFYANPAKHSGVVSGFNRKGRTMVISALTTGVRQHKHNTLNVRFHSFAHVEFGVDPEPTPTPTPDPIPDPTPDPTPPSDPIPDPTPDPTPPSDPAPEPTPTPG